MRRYLYLAGTATIALASAMSATAASAAVTPHVLTINKVGGPAVKVGAILKASLVPLTKATFYSTTTSKVGIKCSKSSFSSKVTVNPLKPGTAKESLMAQSFSSCTVSGIPGITVKSVKLANLPYVVTVSDAAGFPVTVKGSSSTKPLKTTINLLFGTSTITCVYTAASIKGHASNTGSTNKFTNQKFKLSSGPAACLPTGFFTAKYGPIRDTSVTGSPKIFVN